MQKCLYVLLLVVALVAVTVPANANTAPIIDSFTASPAVPAPGQQITLSLSAHDPDCGVPPCTSGCGLTVRSDLLLWSDNTGRTDAFSSSTPSPTGSPWTATVRWVAPPAEGTVRVTVQIADSGGMLCGSRLTTTATLDINVSNAPPPVIDEFTVTPSSVPVGGEAALSVAAHDGLGRTLTYQFSADAGTITQASPSSPNAVWKAPQVAGSFAIRCTVAANGGAAVSTQRTVSVEIGSYLRTLAPAGLRLTRVAALPDARIAAVDGSSNALVLMGGDGQIAWRADGLSTPVAVAVGGGEIFVVERGASRVSVWSLAGSKVRDFRVAGMLLNGIAAGPNPGELAIVDTTAARINVVSSIDGHFVRTIGDGHLSFPTGIVTANGKIAVADPGLSRVVVFDTTGNVSATYGDDVLLVRPQGVAWDAAGQRLIIADAYSAELSIIGEEGAVRGSLGGFGSAAGQLVNPIDVALIPGGVIAVSTANGNVQLYRLLNTLGPLAPPSNVTAADRGGDQGGAVALAWTLSADDPRRVARYRIERSQAGAPFVSVGSVNAGVSSFVDATTTDGICYAYHVVATDGTVEAASPDTRCAASVDNLPPATPAAATAEPATPWAIAVNWAAVSAPDLAGYAIDVSNAAGALVKTVTVSAASANVTVYGLTPDTPYTIGVRAFDLAQNSSLPRNASAATYPDMPPAVPSSVTVTDLGTGGAVNVTWMIGSSPVAAATYQIAATPTTAGWPSVSLDTTGSPATVSGLINQLGYSVTVKAITSWGRASDPSAPVSVKPTAPARDLPIVSNAGWDGTTGIQDAAGLTARVDLEGEPRVLRFEYRTSNAQLQLLLDGGVAGTPLPDTAGSWQEGQIAFDFDKKNPVSRHVLEFRNTHFPDPLAQLAVRKVDLVPLRPKNVQVEPFNTVLDVTWISLTRRADIAAELTRTTIDRRTPPVVVPCPRPILGRCRDPFHDNVENFAYTLTMVSPAGWRSDASEVSGRAIYDDLPSAVTDLWIEKAKDSAGAPVWSLNWTPISTAPSRQAAPVAVTQYRIYRLVSGASVLIAEVSGPPLTIPENAYDPASQLLVVRSVDAQGKESR